MAKNGRKAQERLEARIKAWERDVARSGNGGRGLHKPGSLQGPNR